MLFKSSDRVDTPCAKLIIVTSKESKTLSHWYVKVPSSLEADQIQIWPVWTVFNIQKGAAN